MKVLLELEGVGTIHHIPDNYVVSDGVRVGKRGDEAYIRPRYFGNLKGALEELRDMFIGKQLLKSHRCKELGAFLAKIEKANKEYSKFLVEKGCGGEL